MQLQDLTEQSYELLKTVSSRIEQPTLDFRQTFILLHAKSILETVEDVLALEDKRRTVSSPLLVRGMLENLFILGAATRNRNFARQKIIHDFQKTADCARAAAKKSSDQKLKVYLEDQRNENENIAKKLKEKHQITENPKWGPVECALEAGLLRQYAIEYAHYSVATHAELFSLIQRQRGGSSAHVFRTVAFISLQVVNFLLLSIMVNESEQLEKQRIGLLNTLIELEREGKLKEIYLSEIEGKPVISRGKRTTRLQQN